MSEPEDFLSRWSRLKREAGIEKSGDEQRVDAVPGAPLSSAPAFDPASLPPVESIVADSDIRPFLAAGVPAELTRIALRNAWAADPAIRDFIGIAENQWDFNDPAAIPGFGPLGVADGARDLVARAFASPDGAVEPQCSTPAEEVQQLAAAPADSPGGADADSHAAEITGVAEIAGVAEITSVAEITAVAEITSVQSVTAKNEASPGSPARRPHGRALPK